MTLSAHQMTIRLVLAALSLLALLLGGCGAAMSVEVEEAKKVTASFSGAAFVPPPRTIDDITAILDQQKPDEAAIAELRRKADAPAPQDTDPATLATFHFERALAAREISRFRQEIADFREAIRWARQVSPARESEISFQLVLSEGSAGNRSEAVRRLRDAIAKGPTIGKYGQLAYYSATNGDPQSAEEALKRCLELVGRIRPTAKGEWLRQIDFIAAAVQANVLDARGRYAEAEAFYRKALGVVGRQSQQQLQNGIDVQRSALALNLLRQGRLLEAEIEARVALLSALQRAGRFSRFTTTPLRTLARVIAAQGRYVEAESLARAAVDVWERIGAPEESFFFNLTRGDLAAILLLRRRWNDAAVEFNAIQHAMQSDPAMFDRHFSGSSDRALALMQTDRPNEALAILRVALERSRGILGEAHEATAEIRGLTGVAHALAGHPDRALEEFRAAAVVLLDPSAQRLEDEGTTEAAREQRRQLILERHMTLLVDLASKAPDRRAAAAHTARAFELAEATRGRAVQQAVHASAARSTAGTPALADLVRREQDARKQIGAFNAMLANAMSVPTQAQNAKAIETLRAEIATLARAQQTLGGQIGKDFPAYARLVSPPLPSLASVQGRLRPGEALVSIYVGRERTFVWAASPAGEPSFASAAIGEEALAEKVKAVRSAVSVPAATVGQIPEFDLATAHELYATLLDPVKAGWASAQTLLVVAQGPLAQLPFGLLPTRRVGLGAEQAPLFSRYRAVPWLARTHAVVSLPSVTSLEAVRALRAGEASRRPFAGFGDPYFTDAHAREAAAGPRAAPTVATVRSGETAIAGQPLTIRNIVVSPTAAAKSSRLAMLPRLPDTADEIRDIARAMNAELRRDVFLGLAANEHVVKTQELARYRVLAFATHGLVPSDVDGLTQPALALTAPEIARVEGDGLLTMEEILALRLDADWVVLSACNTANGAGAGGEAISGLGRAFFYAGARSLLVTHWPVETTSARALTTGLFKRYAGESSENRAKALQATMNALIDDGGLIDAATGRMVFSYAHPIFWAPFALVGDPG